MKNIINQIFEIETKLGVENGQNVRRNFERLYHEIELEGYRIVNPLGQRYDERDVSIEANFLSENHQNKISKVIKPAIYQQADGENTLVQKAVVIVE